MHDKFYIIKPAVDTEETGSAYPSVESYPEYDFKSIDSVYNIRPNSFPDFKPNIRFKLSSKANVCDALSQSTISSKGLLVNEKLLDILTSLNSVPHQSYKGDVSIEGIPQPYYWLHLVWEEAIDFIDFAKSKFQIVEFGQSIGSIDIESYDQMKDEQTKLGFMKIIHAKEIFLTNINFDLFVHPFNNTIYISEELKKLISTENITGLSITEASDLVWQPEV